MAIITFKNGEEYILKLSKLANATLHEVCEPAIKDAADLVCDAVREELKNLPTDERFGTQGTPTIGPKKIQKKGLLNSLGISSFQTDKNGMLNVKIGWDGYNEVKTNQWPDGQPNQLVARAIESGTSWMNKNRFVARAVAKARARAVEIMQKRVNEEINKIMR